MQNLKDTVGQWADTASGSSLDKKIERNLTEMSAGSEIQRAAAIKALVIQAQTEEKWLDPIIDSFLRVLPDQLESPQEALIDGLMELRKVRPKRAKEIFEGMQSALDSPYPAVRSRVVEIWTNFSLKSKAKNNDTIADLFEMLSDDDKDVRYQTQESLSKIMNAIPRAALPALKQALCDEDWRVVYHSIVLLTEFAKKYPKPSAALAPEVVSAFNSGEK
ncbi:MAG: HEAT repeat domain-containing protein, partial [Candidatus Thermoplasmatota archaeon]|nr:HEAT repeat domain-containing protein [Candidatus Thermoplasmatota archaeon]